MTTTTPPPRSGPAGMPPHLWELAKSDVRLSIPERVRDAVANGANAPEGVRRIAARIAATGAAMGVTAALVSVGGFADAAEDTPVDLAGNSAPPDGSGGEGNGLDPAPPMPGSADHGPSSYVGGGGPDGGGGGVHSGSDGHGGGFATSGTSGTGDVASGLGTTWHVQGGGGGGPEAAEDWLTVQMFQSVTVTETADGMFVVDAYQYIVIRDDDGHEYVFKEHYQVVVPDPPGQETDLVIHERGHVHVIENPDGSFSVATADYGIDVLVGSDGDGKDEVGITQSERVQVTDADGHDGTVTVDLSETATSTSDDLGDEATTTIEQGQVLTDGELPETPWREGANGVPSTGSGPFVPAGQGPVPAGSGTGSTGTGTGADPAGSRPTTEDPGDDTVTGPGSTGPDPSSPFGETPADRGTGPQTTTATTSSPSSPGTGGGSGGGTAARPVEPAPLASTLGAPAATAAVQVETTQADIRVVATGPGPAPVDPVPDAGPGGSGSGTTPGSEPGPPTRAEPEDPSAGHFAGAPGASAGSAPFEPAPRPDATTTSAGTGPSTTDPTSGTGSTPDLPGQTGQVRDPATGDRPDPATDPADPSGTGGTSSGSDTGPDTAHEHPGAEHPAAGDTPDAGTADDTGVHDALVS